MIRDITTIMGKEFREWLHQRGNKRGGIFVLVVPALIFGIMFPIQTGAQWVTSPISLVSMWWMPTFLVLALIADSIAGERERHTLETLLASRLSDRAILFGKICAATTYSITFTLIIAVISLITVNIAHWEGAILMYPPKWMVVALAVSILLSILASSAGVLVSMRASSAREAQQILTFSIIGVVFVPTILIQVLPKPLVQRFTSALDGIDPYMALAAFLAALVIADAALLSLAVLKFRRSRMILD